jgi:hypothetical protein
MSEPLVYLQGSGGRPMTDREIIEAVLAAALRQTPGPRTMLRAMRAWERCRQVRMEKDLEEMATHYEGEMAGEGS